MQPFYYNTAILSIPTRFTIAIIRLEFGLNLVRILHNVGHNAGWWKVWDRPIGPRLATPDDRLPLRVYCEDNEVVRVVRGEN